MPPAEYSSRNKLHLEVLKRVEDHAVLFGTDLHKALTKYWLFNNWMSVVASRAFSLDKTLISHCSKDIELPDNF